MSESSNPANHWDRDIARVAQELRSRLRSRGITVNDSDSPDDVERLLEAVEEFESAVEAQGGDLMVDEPPSRGNAEPDDPRFLLPKRGGDESVSKYLKRLNAAISRAREDRNT